MLCNIYRCCVSTVNGIHHYMLSNKVHQNCFQGWVQLSHTATSKYAYSKLLSAISQHSIDADTQYQSPKSSCSFHLKVSLYRFVTFLAYPVRWREVAFDPCKGQQCLSATPLHGSCRSGHRDNFISVRNFLIFSILRHQLIDWIIHQNIMLYPLSCSSRMYSVKTHSIDM